MESPSSSSSSRDLMPPPPIPPHRGTTSSNPPTMADRSDPASDSECDSSSDTATVTDGPPQDPSDSKSRPSKASGKLGTRSLGAITSSFMLDDLKAAVSGYQATAAYCLGGKILIRTHHERDTDKTGVKGTEEKEGGEEDDHEEGDEQDKGNQDEKVNDENINSFKAPASSPPITIRFDSSPTSSDPFIQETHKITFPLPTQSQSHPFNTNSQLDALLRACSPATFGHAGGNVLDESYRKAGKLDAESFSTNFHPTDHGILDAVKQTLLPGLYGMGAGIGMRSERDEHLGVRAELYKLNVYSGPSGMFKKHVDTPRGATQFGSLVVCLPCAHEGGQLLISHEGHTSAFDWSTSNSSSEEQTALKWCAFYSDCEHEVVPVTTGHRITITYSLYVSEHVGGILQHYPTAEPSLYPLFEGAKKMLETSGFMSEGGTIGFYCAHQYAHTRQLTDQLMPYALKGIDAVLFAVFSSLGVKVDVRPVLSSDSWNEEDNYYDEEVGMWRLRDPGITLFGSNFEVIVGIDTSVERQWPLVEIFDVQWLNEATSEGWESAMVHLAYGNDYSLCWSYSHAAIFIHIPPRGHRKPIPENGYGFPGWEGSRAAEESD